MTLRYDEIADILRMIDNSSCDELVIETVDLKLVVRRHGAAGAGAGSLPTAAATPIPSAPPGSAPAPSTSRAVPPATASGTAAPAGGLEVRSPMVGTFYRAPKPDAPPFVEIGSRIERGAPLCVIDVMKLFTTISAETAGRIVYIGAENGTLVEFGQVLFVIDPAA
jgi:acetyl-CoA carboxylase biotin carboxyl carrier protein